MKKKDTGQQSNTLSVRDFYESITCGMVHINSQLLMELNDQIAFHSVAMSTNNTQSSTKLSFPQRLSEQF